MSGLHKRLAARGVERVVLFLNGVYRHEQC